MRINFKRYALYLLRWQASTPILAGVGILLAAMGQIVAAVVANLIGGLIFFWVDQFIFTSQSLAAQWEVKENITCVDCGKIAGGTGWSLGTMIKARIQPPSSGAKSVRRGKLKHSAARV